MKPHLAKILPHRVDVVVIGCSTGGPDVLAEILPTLPASFPVPVLIAQHMPAAFTGRLAQRLASQCALTVREGYDNAIVESGTIWIAPGGFHMEMKRSNGSVTLVTNSKPPVHSCRPAADVLFHSAVEVFGSRVLGVVLTGMGRDAFDGCRAIVESGGDVYAQDRATSVVWSMPRHVVEARIASRVLTPADMGEAIAARVMKNRASV